MLVICVVYSVSNFRLKSRSEIKISLSFFIFFFDYEASLDDEESLFFFLFFFSSNSGKRGKIITRRIKNAHFEESD